MSSSIFIGYRRKDSEAWAISIYEKLINVFGRKNIFIDVEKIETGKWKSQILDNLSSSKVMLIIIGKDWLSSRLEEANDIHRLEIREALNKKILIIPIILPDTDILDKNDLPDDIRKIMSFEVIKLATKEETRNQQFKKLYEKISKITKLRKRNEFLRLIYKSLIPILVISFMFLAFLTPSIIESYQKNKYRERWESMYQKTYEDLDTRIFKNIKPIMLKAFKRNPDIDKGIIIFWVINKEIEKVPQARARIPEYIDFFEEILEYCNGEYCNEFLSSYFKRKIPELWGNYRCLIDDLRGNGYPANYGSKIESYYENSSIHQSRRNDANKSRKNKIQSSLELCDFTNTHFN